MSAIFFFQIYLKIVHDTYIILIKYKIIIAKEQKFEK